MMNLYMKKYNWMRLFVLGLFLWIGAVYMFPPDISAKPANGFSYEEWRTRLRQQGLFDETFMVPMRDGVKLSTTVHKSPVGGPYPAILVRTPYGKDDERLEILQLLILKGYALVIQDVRGRFGSEGENLPFLNDGWGEKQDGYDTIEWIAQQKWCDGKVGTWGPSAMGINQSLAAGARPPHLVCQAIGYAASQMYGQAAYQSGVFREALAGNWLISVNAIDALPLFRQHPFFDDFWKAIDIESRYAEMDVPALIIGGWYDIFLEGSLNDFVGRQNLGRDGARGNQKLFIGPWTHVKELKQDQGQLKYPANSMLDSEVTMTVDWFDYWLKGANNTVMNMPAVHYYVMGDVNEPGAPGNEWRTSDSWPIEAKDKAFYLTPANGLSNAIPDPAVMELTLNPTQPVPTTGGANLTLPAGPYDQSALEKRADVLVFSTPPLEQPIEVVGKVRVILYAESNLTDNDLTVRFCDVYPDGRSMLVCDGVARASMTPPYTAASPVAPGQIHAYEVDCWSTALAFNKGHRIRIIVANTNYPRFEINPVYKQLGQNGLPSQGITRIHCSAEYPSALILPVVGETKVDAWRHY